MGDHPLDAPPELLRVATAGSVDDGKSTLIGRLLHDTKSILDDQLDAVELTSRERGDGRLDLALLTDGLRAEREQGITIDVAYRFFTTPRRSFILADTPGHVRYTRNMVTGASTADVALVLIDARQGVVEQSKRHVFLASLLQRPAHRRVREQDGPRRLGRGRVRRDHRRPRRVRPPRRDARRARRSRSPRSTATTSSSPRTPRPGTTARRCSSTSRASTWPPTARCSTTRGCRSSGSCARTTTRTTTTAGTPARWRRATLKVGDDVVVLPAGDPTRIAGLDTYDGPVDEAFAPMSVTALLEDDLDVARGDMLCAADAPAEVARDLQADVCWLGEQPARPSGRYLIKHTTRTTRAELTRIEHRVDVGSLRTEPDPGALELNDIGRVALRTARAAGRRPLRRQPRHRQLHPDRRGDQRHGRRGHGRRRGARRRRRAARTSSGSAARPRARTAGRRWASAARRSG